MTISRIERDKKRRKLFFKYELKRLQLKTIANNQYLPKEIRFTSQVQLAELPKNSSSVQIKNRCVITGRPRAVYKLFKISRIKLRELALSGKLPGVRKSSW
jgi:small subunit ribosomal protein S14